VALYCSALQKCFKYIHDELEETSRTPNYDAFVLISMDFDNRPIKFFHSFQDFRVQQGYQLKLLVNIQCFCVSVR
jgi:hypothetical protein